VLYASSTGTHVCIVIDITRSTYTDDKSRLRVVFYDEMFERRGLYSAMTFILCFISREAEKRAELDDKIESHELANESYAREGGDT
jgi:hypothetical protein